MALRMVSDGQDRTGGRAQCAAAFPGFPCGSPTGGLAAVTRRPGLRLREKVLNGRVAKQPNGSYGRSNKVLARKLSRSTPVAPASRAFQMPDKASTLLRLCNLVSETFARGQPSQAEVQRICALLDSVPLTELGLEKQAKAAASTSDDTVTQASNGIHQHTYPAA
eukprot:scaffold410437_cov41-Prasinocladus_malaysianus.AAC.1